jgi:hypothetical protein
MTDNDRCPKCDSDDYAPLVVRVFVGYDTSPNAEYHGSRTEAGFTCIDCEHEAYDIEALADMLYGLLPDTSACFNLIGALYKRLIDRP